MEENILRKYLNDAGIHAYLDRPAKAPDEYVLLTRTSSSNKNLIETAVIAVQSISTTKAKAASLNSKVKKLLHNADVEGISSIKLTNDYDFTNTAAKMYRYQGVYTVTAHI